MTNRTTYNPHGGTQYPDLFGRPQPAPFSRLLLAAALAQRVGADKITFARNSAATAFDATGAITTYGVNAPRYDHHPVTHAPRGLLLESAATNVFLNSVTGATQTIAVTAQAYTISFYGAGTITLSGVHSHAVAGAGAFPTRVSYTFTPTAGDLVCTVSGTVNNVQLEAGAVASSWVPTTGTAATRDPDIATAGAAVLPSTTDMALLLDFELCYGGAGLPGVGAGTVVIYSEDETREVSVGAMMNGGLGFEQYISIVGPTNSQSGRYDGRYANSALAQRYRIAGNVGNEGPYAGAMVSGEPLIGFTEAPLTQLRLYTSSGVPRSMWLRELALYAGALTRAQVLQLSQI